VPEIPLLDLSNRKQLTHTHTTKHKVTDRQATRTKTHTQTHELRTSNGATTAQPVGKKQVTHKHTTRTTKTHDTTKSPPQTTTRRTTPLTWQRSRWRGDGAYHLPKDWNYRPVNRNRCKEPTYAYMYIYMYSIHIYVYICTHSFFLIIGVKRSRCEEDQVWSCPKWARSIYIYIYTYIYIYIHIYLSIYR